MKPTLFKQQLSPGGSRNLALVLAGLLLGVSLAIHWQGQTPVSSTDAPAARERAAQGIRQLESEQEQLKATIAQLRQELANAQHQAAQNTALLTKIKADLDRERADAGLEKLQGPGVVVQLDDSTVVANATGSAAESYIIHEYDLRDVINLLWNAGAEAIAVNDERLVNTTSIYCVGSTIMVNDTRLSPPYQIRAIGDRKQLEAWLANPAYLSNLRQRVKAYGVQFKVTGADLVDIPAFSGIFRIRYATPGEVAP